MALVTKQQVQGMFQGGNSSSTAGDFVSLLFEIRTNAHIAHLQTKSFAFHKATDELYSDIVGAADAFVEAYQGKFGIITGYKCTNIFEGGDFVAYIQQCMTKIESYRSTLSSGYLEQLVDNIQELLSTTLYKLVNLH